MDNGNVPLVPHYEWRLGVEDRFDLVKNHEWVSQNTWLPWFICLTYLAAVRLGQTLMEKRKAIALKPVLLAWNTLLFVFSALGTVRLFPEFQHALRHFGFRHSICSDVFYFSCPVTAFWTYAFVLSKPFELIDTLFLIMKKRKVEFLHQFHHSSVLIFTWYVLVDVPGIGRWFQMMNFFVHSIMYGYYTLSELKVRLAAKVAICITVCQILQMITGLLVTLKAYAYKTNGEACMLTTRSFVLGISLYFMYGVLFVNFFFKRYFSKSKTR